MREQKKPLLGRYQVIDVDFAAVQVAGERIGNVASDDADAVEALQVLLDARAIFGERDHRSVYCMAQRSYTIGPDVLRPRPPNAHVSGAASLAMDADVCAEHHRYEPSRLLHRKVRTRSGSVREGAGDHVQRVVSGER